LVSKPANKASTGAGRVWYAAGSQANRGKAPAFIRKASVSAVSNAMASRGGKLA